MPDQIRHLSRGQKIAAGVTAVCFICCGCLGVIALFLFLPVGNDESREVANSEEASDITQPESVVESDTPGPANPLPSEPATGELSQESEATITGDWVTVTRIIDGDTIEIESNGQTYRVRYIGMDTPERGAPFFNEATEANRQLVEGQTVLLVKDVSETDRYGRLLRYVYLPDGTFINGELVKQGFALVATFPPDVAHESDFIAWQAEARHAGLGLWSNVVVEAPTNSPAPQPTHTPVPQPLNTSIPQATSTQSPLATNTAVPQTAPGNVVITDIFYDGNEFRTEGDEYVVITNQGGTAINMDGWKLNADDPGQDFWFPAFELAPGQSCRVFTNQVHADSCGGQSFGSGRAIWANTGECGHLLDPSGEEVSTFCYN